MSTAYQGFSLFALYDAIIFTGEAMVEGHALLVENGKVKDIVPNGKIPPSANVQSYGQHILVPGFIDIQVNGGNNILFNSNPTAECCIAIAEAHQKYGTTRLLPTFITEESDATYQAIEAVRKARQSCPNILGIHIEGPHISTSKRGIHKDQYVRSLTASDMRIYHCRSDEIILMTFAPENITPQEIKELHKQGVVLSIGHSEAKAEEVYAALAAGAKGFTHLFNGMGMMTARAPGVAGVALDDRNSWCSLIVDEHHVSSELVRLAVHGKAVGKIVLISDAMPPAATDNPMPFTLYGETIMVENGCCVSEDGRLAGSSITLSDAVKSCVKLGITIDEALRMASSYPAAFLGLDHTLGKLLPGYTADIIALDYAFNPMRVWNTGVSV